MSTPTPADADQRLPVWVVDEDDVRFSIRFALATHNFNAMTYSSGELFLQEVEMMQPGCVVLDLSMHQVSGLDVQRLLKEGNSPIEVIMLSGHATIREAVTAMENGAVSFLEKPVDPDELASKVQLGLERSARKWQQLQMQKLLQSFSRREAQIFELVCQGLTNSEIAAKLFLSQRTVEVHRAHITKKLDPHTPISVLYELVRSITPDELIAGKPKKKKGKKRTEEAAEEEAMPATSSTPPATYSAPEDDE